MQIKFLKPFNGSEDGINLKRFKAEGIYNVPSDLTLELAEIAIDNGYAEHYVEVVDKVEEKEVKMIDDKKIEKKPYLFEGKKKN